MESISISSFQAENIAAAVFSSGRLGLSFGSMLNGE